ncbi:hypothetical protein SNE94_003399 [Vibrio cholerae]|nr:hypothetical protein [Vibrio mimicus]EGR1308167.1 hypothetical protein [Vibrio cholerae]ELY5209150.1 hypothetical protein [Vibrio cholerae]QXC55665.1 hypothetical protein KSS82_05140 [Vibrio mimicus]GHX73335.1 hypothetical protein VCSRO16_3644 [Vibrio cholerae]
MTEKVEGLSEKEVEQLSGIEFQSQSYASFYNTTLEKDKSILTLSVAGIGFLLTLIQFTKSISYYELSFFLIAAASYLVAIYSVISIFGKNSTFIIELVNKRDVSVKQYQLDMLDKTAIRSFYLAILMTVLLGASASQSKFKIGENAMSDNNQVTQQVALMDSCLQASELHKSFQGASALQGATQQQTSAQSQSTGAAAMMPNSASSSSSSNSSGS